MVADKDNQAALATPALSLFCQVEAGLVAVEPRAGDQGTIDDFGVAVRIVPDTMGLGGSIRSDSPRHEEQRDS